MIILFFLNLVFESMTYCFNFMTYSKSSLGIHDVFKKLLKIFKTKSSQFKIT